MNKKGLVHPSSFLLHPSLRGDGMAERTVLITGANGEIGHGLVKRLAEHGGVRIVALDLQSPDDAIRACCHRVVAGDITDNLLLESLAADYDLGASLHLADLLSPTSAAH